MRHHFYRTLAVVGLTVAAVVTNAQSRSSFQTPTAMTGVSVNKLDSTNFSVSLAAGATMTIGGTTGQITDIFGFWALDDDNDLSGTGSDFGVWNYNENYSGTGGIVGFNTNPNTGITQGNSQTFHFNSLEGTVEGYGVHIRLANSNTLYTAVIGNAVPEPASFAILGLGVFGLIRRKRNAN